MATERGRCRIGIVGAGNISALHLEGIGRHPDRMRVVALCDPNKETLDRRAADYGVTETYTDLDEMIAKANLDAAVVCTPTHIRKEVVLPLLEASIPVFCEKPFAETYAEAAELARTARRVAVPIAVNQNFRRHFTFSLGREILEDGALGKPLHLTHIAHVLRRDRGWRLRRRRYVMAVMSIHWFDGYRYLLQDEPESVYCRGINSPATEGGEDTAVSLLLQFRKGTVVSLSESFSSFTKPHVCCLDCEAGGLRMSYEVLTEVRPDGTRTEHQNPYDKAEATYYLLEDLMRSVEEGGEPETSARDNLKSMRILEASYRSLEENRIVRVEEIQ